jgi:hypothetical protein
MPISRYMSMKIILDIFNMRVFEFTSSEQEIVSNKGTS